MKLQILFLIASIALWSCNPSEQQKESETVEEAPNEQSFELVEIDHEGFVLQLPVPVDYYNPNEFSVEMNPAYGQLEVSAGNVFQVEIIEETGNKENLIADLERDLVFEFEVVEDIENGLLYRQFIPNGGKEFWHYYVLVDHNNRQYVVKDAAMSELNEYQSRKIFKALAQGTESGNKTSSL